jgi:hypothetical protein
MEEMEIVGTFDSEDTARQVARALNRWIGWVLEGDVENVPELFEDLGVATDDYALDRDTDVDWPEPPRAFTRGLTVVLSVETSETIDTLSELMESLGAFDVQVGDDEGGEDDED